MSRESNFVDPDLQKKLARNAEIRSSPEFAEFRRKIEGLLAGVKGQDFLFDVDDTLLREVMGPFDRSTGRTEYRYVVNPYTEFLVQTLLTNGNRVAFYTSVPTEALEPRLQAMTPEMAVLPIITSDKMQGIFQILVAWQKDPTATRTDDVLHKLREVYPATQASAVAAAERFCTPEVIRSMAQNPEYLARHIKVPQLFLSPEQGFFIDDNRDYIRAAVQYGWPAERALLYDFYSKKNQGAAVAVAEQIAAEAKS